MHPVLAQSPDQPALTQILLEQAASTPRGTFPRAFHGEQAYWTTIGEPDSPHAALLSSAARCARPPAAWCWNCPRWPDAPSAWTACHSGLRAKRLS